MRDSHTDISMTDVGNIVTQAAQSAGSASAAAHAPELGYLSLEPRPAGKPPVELLPNELLSNIFEFLDSPKPSSSESVLHDEPIFELTRSDNAPLKAASYVSKRWRRGTIPLLFKHAQFSIEGTPLSQCTSLDQVIKPFLDFMLGHQLHRNIQSLTLIVRKHPADIIERLELSGGLSTFWSGLFKAIDPQELLIVAPAEALGILTNCRIYMADAWNFDSPCHYLRLQVRPKVLTDTTKAPKETSKSVNGCQNSNSSGSSIGVRDERKVPTLWNIRPWTTLLLNEGSFIRAYATYEFWLRKPPSILRDLVGADAEAEENTQRPLITPTIRDLSYIGMFPMQTHFAALTTNCPRLNRLYVQLVPRNEILQSSHKMKNVEAEDLWMERNSCYALIMRELFQAPPVGNYKYLQEFESGDAADKDAWDMAVEYVKRAATGWRVASEGVFVRDTKEKMDLPDNGGFELTTLSVNSET